MKCVLTFTDEMNQTGLTFTVKDPQNVKLKLVLDAWAKINYENIETAELYNKLSTEYYMN